MNRLDRLPILILLVNVALTSCSRHDNASREQRSAPLPDWVQFTILLLCLLQYCGQLALNRDTSQTDTTGGNAALYAYTYGYDLAGNVLTVGEIYPSGLSNRTQQPFGVVPTRGAM